MNEQFEDLLAVYVLGGLSPEEEAEVEAYVADNPQAAAQLEEAYAAAALLPYTAPPMESSEAAEAALFARIEADLAPQKAPVRQTAITPSLKPSLFDQIRAFFSTPLVTGVALGTAVLLLVWGLSLNSQIQGLNQDMDQLAAENGTLRTEFDTLSNENLTLTSRVADLQAVNQALDQQLDELSDENADLIANNADLQTTLAETNADMETLQAYRDALEEELGTALAERPFDSSNIFAVTLPGTEDQPDASAQIVIDPVSNTALLIVDDMPELPQESVYQVLLIRGTEHETAETFRVDTEGEGVLLVHSTEPLQSFDAVGVSIEPNGGSVQRTGEIVLLGSLIN